MAKDDQTLLREFAQDRSESAFAELVERHLKLVYSSALRRVKEPHLAQDVAQAVFIELARKPWSVREPRALAGWLYRAATNAASNVLRREGRRRKREHDAMSQIIAESNSVPTWQQLEPHVDDAIHTLNAVDQNIIALRFLEGKSLRETGECLSMTEDAVQKRASRALAKLRDFFARRGLAVTVGVLGTLMLGAGANAGLPTGLSAAVTRNAIAAGASGAGITATVFGVLSLLKTKTALVLLAGSAVIVTAVLSRIANPDIQTNRPAGVSNLPADRSAEPTPPVSGRTVGLRGLGPAPALASTSQENGGNVILAGYVVDDETGQPVNDYALEWGAPDYPTPGAVAWGFSTDVSSPRREGKFRMESGMGPEMHRVWLRVHADGYVPQPVTPEPVAVPSETTNLVVRLHRGGQVWGVVLDHLGRPVPGARIFLAGNQALDLTDGKAEMFRGSTTTTGIDGRFSLSGAGGLAPRVVVVCDAVQVWVAPTNQPTADMRIILPEPATLHVRFDIPGEAERTQLRIELKAWDIPGWKGVTAVIKPFVTNHGELFLTNMAPGSYDFVREKQLRVGDVWRGDLCDRTNLVLQSGHVSLVDCVRPIGFPVIGHISGISNSGASGAFIYIRAADASGEATGSEDWTKPVRDVLTCGEDGGFQSAQLLPGIYTIAAEAYRPETREEMSRSGIRLPGFVGNARVTVTDSMAPTPVTIELRPRSAGTP